MPPREAVPSECQTLGSSLGDVCLPRTVEADRPSGMPGVLWGLAGVAFRRVSFVTALCEVTLILGLHLWLLGG